MLFLNYLIGYWLFLNCQLLFVMSFRSTTPANNIHNAQQPEVITIDDSQEQQMAEAYTHDSSSLQYQEVNYSQQARNQRYLNTLENQDHLILHALFRKDVKLNIGNTSNSENNNNNNNNTTINMKTIGSSYDKGYSLARAKHDILKSMADKS